MRPVLRVATVNLLNDRSRWIERRRLLLAELREHELDLVALQEVTNPLGDSSAHWLAGELGGYSVHVCPKAGWSRSREGIALLSRLPVEGHETIALGSQERTAQLIRVRVAARSDSGGRPVIVANTHLIWPAFLHGTRVRQVERLIAWVESVRAREGENAAVVIGGDFNATPGSPTIEWMRRSYRSAHEAVHGREPEFTCPTPLVVGGRIRRTADRAVLRLMTNRPGTTWRNTLDYLFVSPDVRVVDCGVFLDRPDPDDPTLFASDHLGVVATLDVSARPGAGSAAPDGPPA